jgi:hypothetical protein
LAVALIACPSPRSSAADPPPASNPSDPIWNLNSYLHGTAAEVRDQLNREAEHFLWKKNALQHDVQALHAEAAAAEAAAINAARATPAYKQTAAEFAGADKELDQARLGDDPQRRLAASSRRNTLKLKFEQMEKTAVASDARLAAARKSLARAEKDLAEITASFDKVQQWRNHLLDAMCSTFRMPAPVRVGSAGFLGAVTPHVIGNGEVLVEYDAPDLSTAREMQDREGVVHMSVAMQRVRILLVGMRDAGLKAGQEVRLDQTFVVEDVKNLGDFGKVFVARRKPSDEDHLMAVITPLREAPGASTRPAGRKTGSTPVFAE